VAEVRGDAESARGFVVASTVFDSPAEQFELTTASGRRGDWPVLGSIAALVRGFVVHRTEPGRQD